MKKTLALSAFVFFLTAAFAQNTILWAVQKSGSEKTSYLLGTLHQTGNSFVDDKPMIEELMLKSDKVIFESIEDKNEKVINRMLERADDFSYEKLLDIEDLAFLKKFSANWKVPISKQKPAELLIKLQQEYVKMKCGSVKSTDTTYHMDDYLISIAKRNNVQILGLESFADQFDAINSINGGDYTWDMAKDLVHEWVSNFRDDKNQKEICADVQAYLKMHLDYHFKEECEENDGVLLKRNEKWMPVITELIRKNNSVMVIVGLFHLYGECGIISQLRKEGYTVTPIKLK